MLRKEIYIINVNLKCITEVTLKHLKQKPIFIVLYLHFNKILIDGIVVAEHIEYDDYYNDYYKEYLTYDDADYQEEESS